MAGLATSANDIVPQRSSAAHHAAGAAGTTVRGRPGGIWLPSPRKYSSVEARGYGPTPDTWNVSAVRATCTRIGATPATLTMSGWTTPRQSPAATPASIALPPAPSTCAAASAASAWPAATPQREPMAWTVEVGRYAGALCCDETESRLMAEMIPRAGMLRSLRARAPDRFLDLRHRRRVPGACLRQPRVPARRRAGGRRPDLVGAAALAGGPRGALGAARRARPDGRRRRRALAVRRGRASQDHARLRRPRRSRAGAGRPRAARRRADVRDLSRAAGAERRARRHAAPARARRVRRQSPAQPARPAPPRHPRREAADGTHADRLHRRSLRASREQR